MVIWEPLQNNAFISNVAVRFDYFPGIFINLIFLCQQAKLNFISHSEFPTMPVVMISSDNNNITVIGSLYARGGGNVQNNSREIKLDIVSLGLL